VVDEHLDAAHQAADDDPGGRSPVERGPEPQVRAAGGVVWRVVDGRLEVAVVHRPKYGDWTFPKGKLDPGETESDAAFREVHEETGMRCVLGRELPSVEYLDGKGRHKRVRYWEMTVSDGDFVVNDEVDRLDWLELEAAAARLTYDHDRDVLDAFGRFAGVDTAP
jgi:8-oxo-dGTP pyrophosphatase MutT (NUDIX family)